MILPKTPPGIPSRILAEYVSEIPPGIYKKTPSEIFLAITQKISFDIP